MRHLSSQSKVLVGMSGGVDSTVTAILLQRQGYRVEGVYMKLHDKPDYHEEHFAKAQQAGAYLGIEVHFLDLGDAFRNAVYDDFVQSYRAGLTPNPCVVCNRTIKFGEMIGFADSIGAQYVATGHYVRCDGRFFYQAKDQEKDQSYFLAQVDPAVLPRLIFPLGEWHKQDVKALAAEIPVLQEIASQRESSEICFVEHEYTEVLQRHMQIDQPGTTVDIDGRVVGTHKGYMHYTIGKRRGFYVHGAHDPHYVLAIRPESNQIVVGTREALEARRFGLEQVNLFESFKQRVCEVKVRYRTRAVKASVTIEGTQGRVELQEPVFGLAQGQTAAIYEGERLLGGGTICSA
jgi:tRNA-specific 2-thiouridylase